MSHGMPSDVLDQQAATPIQQIHGEEVRASGHPHAAIVRHAGSVAHHWARAPGPMPRCFVGESLGGCIEIAGLSPPYGSQPWDGLKATVAHFPSKDQNPGGTTSATARGRAQNSPQVGQGRSASKGVGALPHLAGHTRRPGDFRQVNGMTSAP